MPTKLQRFIILPLITLAISFSYAHASYDENELNPLFDTIVQRLQVMQQVAVYKWHNQVPVEDLQREERILNKVTDDAKKLGIQEEAARQFFQAQMNAAKMIQRGWITHWQENTGSVPSTFPDLNTELRPQLNQLGNKIMSLLAEKANVLTQLSSEEVCNDLIPKLIVEKLPEDDKREICINLSNIRLIESDVVSFH